MWKLTRQHRQEENVIGERYQAGVSELVKDAVFGEFQVEFLLDALSEIKEEN